MKFVFADDDPARKSTCNPRRRLRRGERERERSWRLRYKVVFACVIEFEWKVVCKLCRLHHKEKMWEGNSQVSVWQSSHNFALIFDRACCKSQSALLSAQSSGKLVRSFVVRLASAHARTHRSHIWISDYEALVLVCKLARNTICVELASFSRC